MGIVEELRVFERNPSPSFLICLMGRLTYAASYPQQTTLEQRDLCIYNCHAVSPLDTSANIVLTYTDCFSWDHFSGGSIIKK